MAPSMLLIVLLSALATGQAVLHLFSVKLAPFSFNLCRGSAFTFTFCDRAPPRGT
jgi:hypothetical protein